MKSIILYATKYGATYEIVKKIAEKLGDVEITNLKETNLNLELYENVIIGTSIYAGMIRKEAKNFIVNNREVLLKKNLGLFICGMAKDSKEEYFKTNYDSEILNAAKVTEFLGGIFDPKKVNFFERLVMKVVSKRADYIDTISDTSIEEFVSSFTE